MSISILSANKAYDKVCKSEMIKNTLTSHIPMLRKKEKVLSLDYLMYIEKMPPKLLNHTPNIKFNSQNYVKCYAEAKLETETCSIVLVMGKGSNGKTKIFFPECW